MMSVGSLFALPVADLPAINALLNATATVLLIVGLALIKRGHEAAHRRVMLSAFGVSVVFLVCYLVYHYYVGSVKFTGVGAVRTVYFAILISHIVLAVAVPPLALWTIWLGYQDRRRAHHRVARWTFPIWLYVSVTGVVIYLMLYHLYPAQAAEVMIDGWRT